MTVKLKSLAVDLKKEAEGDWVPFLPWKGVRFMVRSTETPEFTAARDKLLRDLAKQRQATGLEIPPAEIDKKLGELYAEHILLNWEGLDEPFTPELALEVLTDPAYREVFKAVQDCANRVGRAELEFVETETKN